MLKEHRNVTSLWKHLTQQVKFPAVKGPVHTNYRNIVFRNNNTFHIFSL